LRLNLFRRRRSRRGHARDGGLDGAFVSVPPPSRAMFSALPITPLYTPLQICDKDCAKIHYIAPNIYCCGAGTSADTENTTLLISSKLEMLRLQTGAPSRVVTAMTMLKRELFKYQGHVSAALVLGGVDVTGPHLYNVYPHGSTDKLPFVTMGSGSLAAMAVFEAGYKDGLTEEEAIALVAAAIRAGIFNDLGSGSNVDITVIRSPPAGPASPPAVSIMRGYQRPNEVDAVRAAAARPNGRIVPRGATVIIKETFVKHAQATPAVAVSTAMAVDA
jgi:20S proteasome subunit beta 2